MNILVLGASGFIGSAIAARLVEAGHSVTGLACNAQGAARKFPSFQWIEGDLRQMQRGDDWREALSNAEVVVNCAGALQSGLRDNVEAVQHKAMLALYAGAEKADISQIIQISAAGSDDAGQSDFMASKSLADAALAQSGLNCCILRPGLVIGRNCYGGSELLRSAAGLPFVAPEISGTGAIQCCALSDVTQAVEIALDNPIKAQGTHDLVESGSLNLGQVIAAHRQWLGFAPVKFTLRVPMALVRLGSFGADLLGWLGWRSPMRSNAIGALVHGIKGDTGEARKLLGREPLSLAQILSSQGPAGKADRWHSRMAMAFPIALVSLFLLWLVSGILGLVELDEAAQIVIDGGMAPDLARAFVITGSIADLAIAAGLLWRPWLSKALGGSLLVTVSYIAGSLVWSGWLWLDPLGPMLKVLPIIALTLLCLAMAEER